MNSKQKLGSQTAKGGFDNEVNISDKYNFYASGHVCVTPKGGLKLGRITIQRKGGTPDPTSLQFKINPLDLFI